MGLGIHRPTDDEGSRKVISDRRLYLAEDGVTVVEHGDPRGASLLVGQGCEIDEDELDRLGVSIPRLGPPPPPEPPRTPIVYPGPPAEADGDGPDDADGEADGNEPGEPGEAAPAARGRRGKKTSQ